MNKEVASISLFIHWEYTSGQAGVTEILKEQFQRGRILLDYNPYVRII